MDALLDWAYAEAVRDTGGLLRSHGRQRGRLDLCAKEALPPFVRHFLQLVGATRDDVFWDLGSGIGTVVAQVALETGCPCRGVELQPGNLRIARALWAAVRRRTGATADVGFIGGCLTEVGPAIRRSCAGGRRALVWFSCKLMPEEVVQRALAMLVPALPPGSRVLALGPLYPVRHGRAARWAREAAAALPVREVPYPAAFVEWGAPGVAFLYERRGDTGQPSPRPAPCRRPRAS